jgi:leucyl/phenylalanyl-tRNA--protein transferase
MPVYLLGDDLVFPPVDHAEDGLLAVGGDLGPERLLRAYAEGIFPWYSEGGPILWHSPDPRFVLTLDRYRVPRSLGRVVRSGLFEVTLDRAFGDVVEACRTMPRPVQDGTWITPEMKDAYLELHALGFAHSAEAWSEGELAGGLYGVSLGAAFFGESMFARRDDASKVAFVTLVDQLARWGITLIDCQVETEHLARFGAENWPRERFLKALTQALEHPTRRGRWSLEPGPDAPA